MPPPPDLPIFESPGVGNVSIQIRTHLWIISLPLSAEHLTPPSLPQPLPAKLTVARQRGRHPCAPASLSARTCGKHTSVEVFGLGWSRKHGPGTIFRPLILRPRRNTLRSVSASASQIFFFMGFFFLFFFSGKSRLLISSRMSVDCFLCF